MYRLIKFCLRENAFKWHHYRHTIFYISLKSTETHFLPSIRLRIYSGSSAPCALCVSILGLFLYACLCVPLSVCLSTRLFISLSFYRYLYSSLLSASLLVCLPFCLSVFLTIYLSKLYILQTANLSVSHIRFMY